jgi:hypothetical protein
LSLSLKPSTTDGLGGFCLEVAGVVPVSSVVARVVAVGVASGDVAGIAFKGTVTLKVRFLRMKIDVNVAA